MSDNSKGRAKRGALLRTNKKNRPKPNKADPQLPAAAEEDPRGRFLFCMGKRLCLVKCEHYELPPSLEITPDGQPVDFLRHACSLEVETVPPNRFARAIVYYTLKAEIRVLPSGKLSIPEWATPYEIQLGVVVDVYGGEWMMESFREEIIESAVGEATASAPTGRAAETTGRCQKDALSIKAEQEQTKKAVLPGWKRGKLVLKQLPNGNQPAAFAFGNETYTVPSGKAWATVSRMIEEDAFEGHGIMLSPRAGDVFKKENRSFYSDIIKTADDGKRYLRTK